MIILVGTSNMAIDYAKVLKKQNLDFMVVGRGKTNAEKFEELTGIKPLLGGVEGIDCDFIESRSITKAIVATGVETLASVSSHLISVGVKDLLVEKPGAIDVEQLETLLNKMETFYSNIYIAYNRRFYASVAKAREIIREDGQVVNFHFELTEWGHVIKDVQKDESVKDNWFFANTTHVVDLAFHLGGAPSQLASFTTGSSEWHERSYVYAGAGVSNSGALFSYSGNWGGPGRWSVEVLTSKHRLIFRPMEKLQIQEVGSIEQRFVDIDDSIDIEFKPGLFKQVEAFLSGDVEYLCPLSEQVAHAKLYKKMANY